jgi:hypothetical protein
MKKCNEIVTITREQAEEILLCLKAEQKLVRADTAIGILELACGRAWIPKDRRG